jgi:hypothetical protein
MPETRRSIRLAGTATDQYRARSCSMRRPSSARIARNSRALVTGYENLIDGLDLPDPDDRHVLAAAIRGRADVIVTANLKDFPAESLAPFGIDAQHPDEFILHLLDLAPGKVSGAARDHRQSLKNPPKTIEEYLDTLEAQGLTQTVSVLREYVFKGDDASLEPLYKL